MRAGSASFVRCGGRERGGLKNTLIGATVLISDGPACCNSAKRSTDRPPSGLASTTEGGRAAGACGPKVMDPVMPTENEFQLLPEKGKVKFLRVASLLVIAVPKSASHFVGVVSTRKPEPSGVNRRLWWARLKRL